jgi:hypothetical protein
VWTCPLPSAGWFPKLNWPYVASGNLGVFISNVQAGIIERYLTVVGYPHGWYFPNRLLCSEIEEPNGRFVFFLEPQTISSVGSCGSYQGLLQICASLGHWACWDDQSQIWYDGQVIAKGYHSIRQHGEYVVGRCVAEDYTPHVFYQGRLLRKIQKVAEVYDWDVIGDGPDQGTVVYGYPRLFISYPSGVQKEVTVSPYGEGGTGGQGMRLVDHNGTLWLWTAGGIGAERWGILGRPVGETQAIVLDMPSAMIDVQLADGLWRVAGCDDQGQLRVEDVPPDAPRQTIIKTPPALKMPSVPVIGRPCWFGYYKQFSAQYGDNPNAPSNCAFIEDSNKMTVPGPIMVGDAAMAISADPTRLFAVYTTGNDADMNANALAWRAAIPGLAHIPIWGCFDGGQTMPTVDFPAIDVLGIECYVGASESAADCEARVRAYLSTIQADRRVFLIGQSYTSNTNNTSDPQTLLNAQVIPAAIARDDKRVQGILMFSDGRPTGTRDHEQWRPLHERILMGIVGVPEIPKPIVPIPLPPPIVVPPVAQKPKKAWWEYLLAVLIALTGRKK